MLADLAATPAVAAGIELYRIPELLGKIERPRAVLWARLMMGSSYPEPGEGLLMIIFGGLPNLGFHSYGYAPSGIGGILLVVVVVLLLTGRL